MTPPTAPTSTSPRAHTPGKILWLSILQGWAILLVVVGHVNAFTYSGVEGEMYEAATWIQRFCYSFHMPLFMFVSGGLLYLTRLHKGWDTLSLYRDKAKRLAAPFVLFTLIGFLIKIPFAGISKTGLDVSAGGLAMALFDPGSGPIKEMWFVGSLMWLMLLYPLYRVALRSLWGGAALVVAAAALYIFAPPHCPAGWFSLGEVAHYAVYFTAGMLFFKYDCMRLFAERWWAVVAVTAIYVACFLWAGAPRLATAFAGILASVAWAIRLTRFPGLFAAWRDHSFQIFLVGIFPQMLVELVGWKHYHQEWMQLPYYAVSCLLAIACGVAMSKIASHLRPEWLRWGFGLK